MRVIKGKLNSVYVNDKIRIGARATIGKNTFSRPKILKCENYRGNKRIKLVF